MTIAFDLCIAYSNVIPSSSAISLTLFSVIMLTYLAMASAVTG